MVALCDSEDFETRRAAAGALAILSSFENSAVAIGGQNRVVETLLEMAADENVELQHRAVETIKNLARDSRDVALALVDGGAVPVLAAVAQSRVQPVALACFDALSALAAVASAK
eukprot:jgi/Hompol1/6612/HPOL_000962-RA